MPISFVDQQQTLHDVSPSTSTTVTTPVGIQVGDRLLHHQTVAVDSAHVGPAGWVQVGVQENQGQHSSTLWIRVVDGTEDPSYTWTHGNSRAAGRTVAYRAVQSLADVDVVGTTTSSTSIMSPAVTVPQDGWLLIMPADRRNAPAIPQVWSTDVGTDVKRGEVSGATGANFQVSSALIDSNVPLAAGSYQRTVTADQTWGQVSVWAVALEAVPEPPPPPPPPPTPVTEVVKPGSRFAKRLLGIDRNPLLDLDAWVGQRSASFRFDLVDGITGQPLGQLHPRRDTVPTLTHTTNATIKRQLTLSLGAEATAQIDPINNRVHPFMIFGDGAVFPLGRYMFTETSRARFTSGLLGDMLLFDEMFLVDQQLTESFAPPITYTGAVPTATTTVDVAIGLLLDGLPITALVAPTPFWTVGTWPAGNNRGAVLEDLSVEGDYFSPWFGNDHALHVIRIFDPSLATPDFDFDESNRVLRAGIVESDNLLTAPNRWVVISNGTASEDEAEAPIVGVFDLPASAPHSTANRGFVVAEVVDMQVDNTQQANAIAAALGQRQTVFETVELSTPPDPRHDSYNVIVWQGAQWLEIGWTMQLIEGGEMRHVLRKAYGQ